MKNLDKLPRLAQLAGPAGATFWAFNDAATAEGAIPKKYKELMAIAVALTTQCVYCIELHRKVPVAISIRVSGTNGGGIHVDRNSKTI